MSVVDELLRYMRIYGEDDLKELEGRFAGAIQLGPAGRYGCRMLVMGVMLEFKLGYLPGNKEEFFVTQNGKPFNPSSMSESLYRLARHKAAEVIGAVRAGHHEYNIRSRRNPTRRATIF